MAYDERKYQVRRMAVFFTGLTIAALGVILSAKATLGTTPFSSVPLVMSLGLPLTIGQGTIIMNIVLALLGILVMGREFKLTYLSEMIMVLFFSVVCDILMFVIGDSLETDDYAVCWLIEVVSMIVLSFGASLEIAANISMMPGDYLVIFLCYRTHIQYHRMKVTFDVIMIGVSVLLSLIFFGYLNGVREGTIFAAITVGPTVGFLNKQLAKRFYGWVGHRDITSVDLT